MMTAGGRTLPMHRLSCETRATAMLKGVKAELSDLTTGIVVS
jgi:hypothetical protein